MLERITWRGPRTPGGTAGGRNKQQPTSEKHTRRQIQRYSHSLYPWPWKCSNVSRGVGPKRPEELPAEPPLARSVAPAPAFARAGGGTPAPTAPATAATFWALKSGPKSSSKRAGAWRWISLWAVIERYTPRAMQMGDMIIARLWTL